MISQEQIAQLFPIHLPIAKEGVFWNGRPDEYSNIYHNLNYSQKFGLTPFAKTGAYGYYNGQPIPHFGHDYANPNEDVDLVFQCQAFPTYIGYEEKGYGHFIFYESETKTINGDAVKMQYVIAHMRARPALQTHRWYEAGTVIEKMGNTGFSTGQHTHNGGRPLIRKPDGSFEWLFNDPLTRGYIDLEPCLIEKPVYDKQILINQSKEDLIIKDMLEKYEKKIIIEGTKGSAGRKFVVVDGVLQEIKDGRESDAALYVMANNGLGGSVSTELINKMPKGKNF